jgi:hypothetical protein
MQLGLVALFLSSVINSKCLKVKESGSPCADNSECMSGICTELICAAAILEGKPCGPDALCATGFGCSSWKDGICKRIAQRGESCQLTRTGPHLCDNGLLCYDGICDVPKGADSPCSDFVNECGVDQKCNFESNGNTRCTPLPTIGNHCDEAGCQTGLFCNKESLICEPLKKENQKCLGSDCAQNLDCLANKEMFFSFFKPRKCQKLPSEGEDCDKKCAVSYYCDKSV